MKYVEGCGENSHLIGLVTVEQLNGRCFGATRKEAVRKTKDNG